MEVGAGKLSPVLGVCAGLTSLVLVRYLQRRMFRLSVLFHGGDEL